MNAKKFKTESENIAFDKKHRKTIAFNISKYDDAVHKGKDQFQNLELARERAANIKREAIYNLDKYLLEFETNFIQNGGKVLWAENSREAAQLLLEIAERYSTKMVVKSKSMTTEEIEVNKVLEDKGIESVETDLGEYIVQLAGERPYHIVTPAMHKSKEDVAELFNRKLKTPSGSSPEFLTGYVRKLLRKKYVRADLGITGANFLIANTGSVALTENEGNGLMSTSFPKVHVVIAGIEKILPKMEDLNLMWSLLSSCGTGQKITAYNSLFSGPAKKGEIDGPNEMIVILLDNGRSRLLNKPDLRDALACIRCGACLNGCPVYKNIGGYTYDSTYSGPIGSVITPHLIGGERFIHLSFASSLCGRCAEVCPVKIDLPKLLLINRREAVKDGLSDKAEVRNMKLWKKLMVNRSLFNTIGSRMKNFGMKMFGAKAWGPRREIPVFPKRNFNKLWKKGTRR